MIVANVATRSKAMERVVEEAESMRVLMGGTERMRSAGKDYLPQKEAESDAAYKARLEQSFLYGKVADVVYSIGTKLFSNKLIYSDTANADILDSVDTEGRDITQFASEWVTDALQAGVSFAMVDYPSGAVGLTAEQERTLGLRPYVNIIKVENLLSFKTEQRGANTVLTRVNIFETVEDESKNEWEELFVDQVRVLRLGDVMTYELWRQNKNKDWMLYEEPLPTNMDFIPLCALYTHRTGYMTGSTPLRDIADLNIAHWQSSSAQRHILNFVRFPLLFGKGLVKDDMGNVVIGVNRLLEGQADGNSDLKHVEHTGAGIEAGAKDLETIENQMDALAKMVLTRKSGNVTATARAIDEASSNSDIEALANIVQATVNKLIEYMGAWTNKDYGTVELSVDFGLSSESVTDIDALKFAVTVGAMSKAEYMQELIRRDIKKEYDMEADVAMIDTGGSL